MNSESQLGDRVSGVARKGPREVVSISVGKVVLGIQ